MTDHEIKKQEAEKAWRQKSNRYFNGGDYSDGQSDFQQAAIKALRNETESSADRWLNDGEFGYPEDEAGKWMAKKLKEAYIAGSNRTIEILETCLPITDETIKQ